MRAVAAQVWPLLTLVLVLFAVAVVWYLNSGDRVPLRMAWWFVQAAVLGLVGSFGLHESAHAVVLRHSPGVSHIVLERTAWRTSLLPVGELTARQVVAVAVAGPFACMAVGLTLWWSPLGPALAWWYLAHGLFLLPCFGDGRSLVHGLRGRGAMRVPWSRS